MPKYTNIQNSFVSGEVSPKIEARTDIREYANGVETMKNMLSYKSGGAVRRPGMRIIESINSFPGASAKSHAEDYFEAQLVIDSTEYYRVFVGVGSRNEIVILDKDENNIGAPALLGKFQVTGTLLAFLALQSDPKGFHYTQIKEGLYFTHNSGTMPPFYISIDKDPVNNPSDFIFTADLLFNFAGVGYQSTDPTSMFGLPHIVSLPMLEPNSSDITFRVTTGSVNTVGASVSIIAEDATPANYQMFTLEDVGNIFIVDDRTGASPLQYWIFEVTSLSGGTEPNHSISARILYTSGSNVPNTSSYWYEAAWSAKRGYPRTVASFESRLFFGGNKNQPDTIWASKVNLPVQMSNRIIADGDSNGIYARAIDDFDIPLQLQPFNATISSTDGAAINWMNSGRTLEIGTQTAEYVATGGDNSIMTPLTGAIQIKQQSAHGGSPIMSVASNSRTYFVSRDGKSIMEFGFSPENGSYISRNISNLSEEIIHRDETNRDSRITRLAWNESRGVLWVLTNKKKLYGISIDLSAGVLGWNRHITSSVEVYDISSQMNSDNTYVDTHLIVGASDATLTATAFLVKMTDDFEHNSLFNSSTRDEDKPVFLDMGQYLTFGAATTSFNVITEMNTQHGTTLSSGDLDGYVFKVLRETATGFKIETVTVGSDTITLTASTQNLVFGYAYESKLRTLVPEVGPNSLLNSQGDIQRFDRATFLLYKTRTGEYGIDDTQYDFEIDTKQNTTGKVRVDIPSDSGNDSRILVQTSEPLPMSILGIILRGVNNS